MCNIIKAISEFRVQNFRPTYHNNLIYHKSYRTNSCRSCLGIQQRNTVYSKVISRIKLKLLNSKTHAIKRGHKSCTSLLADLLKTYTEFCQICNIFVGTRICLEHCHKTGKFRGWTCITCNDALKAGENDPQILIKCAEYLQKHNQEVTE
jgi:hypothetical protein